MKFLRVSRLTSTGILLGSLFLLIFGYTNSSFAAKPTCPSDHPSCDDGGGDPPAEPIFEGDTRAHWSLTAAPVWEGTPRICSLESAATNGSSGHYVCDLTVPTDVNFQLGLGTEIDKKGNPVDPSDALCSSMGSTTVPVVLTPTHYPYDWSGTCTDGGCDVQVLNWFAPDANINRPDPDRTGLVILTGSGTIPNPTSNANPYADYFVSPGTGIQIDEVVVTFKANGKNRNEAVCRWGAAEGLSGLEFNSVPNP